MTINSTRRRFVVASSLAALLAGSRLGSAKPLAAPRATADSRAIEGVFFYGQSNAGAGGHATPILTQPVYPDRVFSFRDAQQTYGGAAIDPNRLQGVGAVRDHPKYAPFPATAMAYALAQSETTFDPALFIYTAWYGGQPLTAFLRGGGAWGNLTAAAHRMRDVLSGDKASRVAALVVIQGESGPPGRSPYRDLLNLLLDQTLPELKTQTGQTNSPVAIILQTNASNAQSATAKDVALAQWDAARARPRDAVLAGPMYQFPLDDAVHQSTIGRLMLGDLLALVYEARVRRSEPFEPLHPLKAIRDGDTIRITFKRPAGSRPLQWDRSWMRSVPDYGFALADEGGAAAIESVQITGSAEIVISPASKRPRGAVTVRYAMKQPLEKGWAPGRGQLIAPTQRRSAFADLQTGAPEFVAHYCIRFELPVE